MTIYSLDGVAPVLPENGDYWVAPDAVLAGRVRLLSWASIWFGAVLRGDNDEILIGARTSIQDLSVLHTDIDAPLAVGADCVVGHKVMLHGCTIGDGTLIGINATVLNHVKIGKNCIVGAHTLITEGKVIPDNSMVLGSPGKIVRPVTAEEIETIKTGAAGYVENARRFRDGLRRDPRS